MKTLKKLFAVMLTMMMLLNVLPVQAASALDVPESLTYTLYSSKDASGDASKKNKRFAVWVPAKVTSLKSSKKSVATVTQAKVKGVTGRYVYVNLKKPGTTTISFKYKSKTYKTKITVKKYVNPVASVKIGSTVVSSSKFKSRSETSLKYSKFANKKVKVNIKLKSGWKLVRAVAQDQAVMSTGAYFDYAQKGWWKSEQVKNNSKIKIAGGKGYQIIFGAVNTKTKQYEKIVVRFK